MSSIFDLKTSTAQIAQLNRGVSRVQYDQVAPSKDSTGDNFHRGMQHYRWALSRTRWWVPSKSYIRMRCSLTQQDGTTQLLTSDDVAPNMGLASNLFQSMEFRIADKTISRISSDVAQIDALEKRLNRTKSWLDGIGAQTNFWQPRTTERRDVVSVDGVDEKGNQGVQIFNKVDLGFDQANTVEYDQAGGGPDRKLIFADGAGPAGTAATGASRLRVGDVIEFVTLNAASKGTPLRITEVGASYAQIAEDTPGADVAAANVDFVVYRHSTSGNSRRVKEFEIIWQPPLSVFKVNHALPTAQKYELIMTPQNENTYKKQAIESLLGDKTPGAGNDFEFKVNDIYLYVATIDAEAVENVTYMLDLEETRVQSIDLKNQSSIQQKHFDVSPSTKALTVAFQDNETTTSTLYSASKFKIRNNLELNLNRLFIEFAGQSRPSPDADPSFTPGDAKDYTVQRYVESVLHSGMYFNEPESLTDWHDRGAYYYFQWPRDSNDRSTQATVHAAFNPAPGANANCLLFDHYRSVAKIRVEDGMIADVSVETA